MTTQQQGYKPRSITATQAEARVRDVRELVQIGDAEEAAMECAQLYLDILHTLAHAPTYAYVTEIRRLATLGLDAFEIQTVASHDSGR